MVWVHAFDIWIYKSHQLTYVNPVSNAGLAKLEFRFTRGSDFHRGHHYHRTESSYLLYVGLMEHSRVSCTKCIENLVLSVLAIDSATTCYNKAYRTKHNHFSQHSTFDKLYIVSS